MCKPGERLATSPDGSFPEKSGHPPELLAQERSYIVRWGMKEAFLVASGTVLFSVLLGILGALSSPYWLLLLVPVLFIGVTGVLFFRNPIRRIPSAGDLFLAPADGKVVEVSTVNESEYVGGEASKVGIFMSIFNVHLNRAPCSGRVEYLCHRSGKFLDARNTNASRENESQAIGILRDDSGGPSGVRVLVRQVAGAIARRIVCPLREGLHLEQGRLIGMIKFGSRTEVFVAKRPGDPPTEILVKVGDRVRAGRSVLFRYHPTGSGGSSNSL